MLKTFITIMLLATSFVAKAQVINDSNTPLHLMKPNYDTPYGIPTTGEVKASIDKVLAYLETAMPAETEKVNGKERIKAGDFRLTSYEVGVLYNACLAASQSTGDARYRKFTTDRLSLVADLAPRSMKYMKDDKGFDPQMRKVCFPTALDDAGAMCSSYIRMLMTADSKTDGLTWQAINYKKVDKNLHDIVERYIDHIMNKQYRLADGTLARIRPHYNTVWLDDMYMGIPALAFYGKLMENGNAEESKRYFDETIRQMLCFESRMWVPEKKLFRHGWVEEMPTHPCFPWGRANGWALLTMCEVLDALPANHPERGFVLQLLRQHIEGLCALQDKTGLWHQLLDRQDTYLETSATAIYTYCMAHAICEGWIDAQTFGAQTLLGWNAVATQINAKGQVENTCVGSGMGFDPAFYSYRPVHVMAAHGYGPVIWAGGEIVRMLKKTHPKMNDSAVQFYRTEQKTTEPIFSEEREGVEKEEVLW